MGSVSCTLLIRKLKLTKRKHLPTISHVGSGTKLGLRLELMRLQSSSSIFFEWGSYTQNKKKPLLKRGGSRYGISGPGYNGISGISGISGPGIILAVWEAKAK